MVGDFVRQLPHHVLLLQQEVDKVNLKRLQGAVEPGEKVSYILAN